MPTHKPRKILRPHPELLARTLDDLFAEQDQVMEQIRRLRERSQELLDAVNWMKRKEYRHKWTAP